MPDPSIHTHPHPHTHTRTHTKQHPQKQALEHAYFHGPHVSKLDGSEHATPRELAAHERTVRLSVYAPPPPPILVSRTCAALSYNRCCWHQSINLEKSDQADPHDAAGDRPSHRRRGRGEGGGGGGARPSNKARPPAPAAGEQGADAARQGERPHRRLLLLHPRLPPPPPAIAAPATQLRQRRRRRRRPPRGAAAAAVPAPLLPQGKGRDPRQCAHLPAVPPGVRRLGLLPRARHGAVRAYLFPCPCPVGWWMAYLCPCPCPCPLGCGGWPGLASASVPWGGGWSASVPAPWGGGRPVLAPISDHIHVCARTNPSLSLITYTRLTACIQPPTHVPRRHGRFCRYDTAGLPSCAGSHSMLPLDPHSGWCDVQGRRATLEDFHKCVGHGSGRHRSGCLTDGRTD